MQQQKLWTIFYSATLLFGCAEGFFLILSLYINHLGGNEKLTGVIFFFQAIGAITLIPFGGIILRYIKVIHLILIGITLFTIGAAIFWLSGLNQPLYFFAGLLVGAGWGITYTATPVTVATISEPKNNVVHFGILAACNMLGMGISPVVAELLEQVHQLNLIYFISVILSIISGCLFFILSRHAAIENPVASDRGNFMSLVVEEIKHWQHALLSHSRYPILMVFLGACVFSTMANFQATFAEKNQLNYSIYYVAYTAAVILARIFISPYLKKFNLYKVGVVMLSIMCLGLMLFPFIGSNNSVYAMASILLGIGYGLTYPVIKAQAIEGLAEARRASTLICFSLSYFIGLYVFPLAAGFLIVEYGYKVLLLALLGLGFAELLVGIYSLRLKLRVFSVSRVD